MKWGYANTAAIVRTLQKDLYYRQELTNDTKLVLLDYLSAGWYFRLEEWVPLLVDLMYYGVQTGMGNRTLGEAYSRICPVDTTRREFLLKDKLKRITWLLSGVLFPFLLKRQFKNPRLLKLVDLLLSLNSSLFYYTGKFPFFSNRLLSIRYIFYPRKPPMLDGDALLYKGFAILLGLVTLNKAFEPSAQNDNSNNKNNKKKKSSKSHFKCPVCYEDDLGQMGVFTSVLCGHVYCWHCITKWILSHDSNINTSCCPVCRVSCAPTDLLLLMNI